LHSIHAHEAKTVLHLIARNAQALEQQLHAEQYAGDVNSGKIKIYEWNGADDTVMSDITKQITAEGNVDVCVNAIGSLHSDEFSPEKTVTKLDPAHLLWSYQSNVVPCALILKHIAPKLNRERASVLAHVTAKVGSIEDNGLGGWHSYRSSKAAMHQLIKTTAIEIGRKNKNACVMAVHPGTVKSNLSQPFQKNVLPGKLFSPEQSVDLMMSNALLPATAPESNGSFYSWDGSIIPW
jgi:NAD(P)-dependent dehydrogenase (short-subunit alcohol dehydrogenase family)